MLLSKNIIPLFLLLLCGCATMNQSECQNADWQMIGLEDGAQGRALSYIGKHRQACAEFDISPDLAAYQSGHKRGLRQYCTYNRGFQLGRHGNSFRDFCPEDLKPAFQLAYERGREIHALGKEVKRAQSAITSARADLQDMVDYQKEVETLIIDPKTRVLERALLLNEVKETQTEISQLEAEIDRLQQQKADLVQDRNMLSQRYQTEAGPLRERM